MLVAAVTLRAKNLSIIIVAVKNSYDTKCIEKKRSFLFGLQFQTDARVGQ